MTFPQVGELFDYWRKSPPAHEMLAILTGAMTTWKPPKTAEEEIADGAMGPEEFAEWFKATGGKIDGVT
ncbi:MAG: hypothetical protein JWL84_587 [Rhodospirillales bacterium]|nr:hypothetical protein [Rhodospirillales bacterium]